eukprot:TRINITY_DN14138_c0_g1_i1.p1 TRINITY_DN14138_c0_g1~~TRINITY_DN14138_c0_g1_i1.p1  ORF type:complete len:107 (-),score=3.82 TRINITY_DN14138_c0_g1_i1:43-363(-)
MWLSPLSAPCKGVVEIATGGGCPLQVSVAISCSGTGLQAAPVPSALLRVSDGNSGRSPPFLPPLCVIINFKWEACTFREEFPVLHRLVQGTAAGCAGFVLSVCCPG